MLRIIDNGEVADIAEEGRLALDDNGRVIDGSSFASRLLGQDVGNLAGQSAEDLFELSHSISDIRPDAPILLNYRGRTLQAVLTVPEARQRSHTSLVTARPTEPALRTVDLAEESLRINPILSQALDRARRLLSAGLPLVITGESGSGKTSFAKTVARCCFGEESEIVFIDCASLQSQGDMAIFAATPTNRAAIAACLLIRPDRRDGRGAPDCPAGLAGERPAGRGQWHRDHRHLDA